MQASPTRVFALSLSGRVYTLSSSPNESTGQKQGNSSWNPLSWGSNEGLNNDYVELKMDQKLTKGEKSVCSILFLRKSLKSSLPTGLSLFPLAMSIS